MIPTSPRQLFRDDNNDDDSSSRRRCEHNYHYRLRQRQIQNHAELEWTPPDGSESSSINPPSPYLKESQPNDSVTTLDNHQHWRHLSTTSQCIERDDGAPELYAPQGFDRYNRPYVESRGDGDRVAKNCDDGHRNNFYHPATASTTSYPNAMVVGHRFWPSLPTIALPIFDRKQNNPLIQATTTPMSPIRSSRRKRARFNTHQHQQSIFRETDRKQTPATKSRRRVMGRNRRKRIAMATTTSNSFGSSHLDLPSLSSSSTASSRSNKIYVRIKRFANKKQKAKKSKTEIGDTKHCIPSEGSVSNPHRRLCTTNHPLVDDLNVGSTSTDQRLQMVDSVPLPLEPLNVGPTNPFLSSNNDTRFAISSDRHQQSEQDLNHRTSIIHYNNDSTEQGDKDDHAEASRYDDDILFYLPTSFPYADESDGAMDCQTLQHNPSEWFLMTQKLLAVQTGPISWASIPKEHQYNDTRDPSKLHNSFAAYLSEVLMEVVPSYLRHHIKREYWVKRLRFWRELLDPRSLWWNTDRGLLHMSVAKHLHTNLCQRWGDRDGDSMIEWDPGADQTLYVRACVLFARGKSNGGSTKDNGTR